MSSSMLKTFCRNKVREPRLRAVISSQVISPKRAIGCLLEDIYEEIPGEETKRKLPDNEHWCYRLSQDGTV